MISTPTASAPRLSPADVQSFLREGYFVFRHPVLPPDEFQGLKSYFESMLSALPASERPESMDVPHFMHPKLLHWALAGPVLDLVECILGPDLALFATHFICKPKGNGKRVPWHEDSYYWQGLVEPMNVCTVWLAIDPSLPANGCMRVIPRTHLTGKAGFSDYDDVDPAQNVFPTEITRAQRDESRNIPIELQPNECSLHDARVMHGSEPNTSSLRRCGWTLRFCPTTVKFNAEKFAGAHQVYLARGQDRGGNTYADPSRSYPELMARRAQMLKFKNSH